ncbi:MAG: RND family transporter [Candidatus Aminicenantes bacterium]|nr:RND family transporter [Candidatus Aminicenantes bacterium]MBL7083482.1 RND family transporter [Candidatus Aminicenantes bacterium]
MNAIADVIIKFRWIVILIFIILTVFFASQIPRVEINSEMKSLLPPHLESRINTDKIDELFGGVEMLMLIIKTDDVLNPETLKRVKNISRQMKRIKGVDKVLSIFELKDIRGENGAMVVNPAVKRIPQTEKQKKKLREELRENDIVYGSVVSEDFTITAVIALLKTDVKDEYIVGEIKKLLEQNPGKEEVVLGGLPNMRVEVTKSIQTDLRKLLPLALFIMLIFLFICFKQLRGVMLPFLVVIMSILVSMGMIPLLGWKIEIITIILPVLLVAIANDYGIHMIAKYQELNVEGNPYSKKELAKGIFQSLSKPVFLTGLTTMSGMLCLFGHILLPARKLGVLASLGIAFALAASLLFIPAIISFLPKAKSVIQAPEESRKKPLLERLLQFFGDFVSWKPKAIVTGAVVCALAASIGIFFIVIDADPNNYYPKDSPIVYAADLINENLGGAQNISVVFEGDIKNPGIMKKIDYLEKEIEKIPEVGSTSSVARVVRMMSRVLNDEGEKWYDVIPDTRNAVAQYFELYSMSGDPEDFEKMVDFPYEHALITARINTSSTPKLYKIKEQIEEMVKDDEDVKLVGGFALILADIARLVVSGQLRSLGLAVLMIGILIMFLFRSVVAGLISAIPLALSVVFLFSFMGLFGIELNIATALLSSIMIGVGVDYTIHFLWRYREERRNGAVPQKAVKKTLTTTGRGIVFNAFSVIIGFTVLITSSFMPVRFFGFLIVVSIFACLVGALVFIPALCLVFKPKFLEPRKIVV